MKHNKAAKNNKETKKKAQTEPTQPADKAGKGEPPAPGEKRGQSFSHVIGQIIWLMGKSNTHRYLMVQELEWLLFPPVMMKQFMLFFNEKKQVVGAAFWAYVNEEIEERFKSGKLKLRPGEWKNGDRLWLIEIIAPFGKSNEMLKQLQETAFRGKQFKALGVDMKTGKKMIQSLEGKSIIKDVKVKKDDKGDGGKK